MPSSRTLTNVPSADLHGSIDIAIITIREDEEKAVLKRFPPAARCEEIPCGISYVRIEGGFYSVAVTRCPWQGTNQAQKVTESLIRKLAPKWIIAVGIAGGVPDNEFSLGDVILANHVYDLSVSAAKQGKTQYSLRGGDVHELVIRTLGGLGTRSDELRGWNNKQSLKVESSLVDPAAANSYGDEDFQAKVRQSLRDNFPKGKRPPRYTVRPIVSSSQLVQDTERVKAWSETMRHFAAIEMEFAGVYLAAKGRGAIDGTDLPVLTIRGISDIVGLKREGVGDWTDYACNTAAALTKKLVELGFFGQPRPGDPPIGPGPTKKKKPNPRPSTHPDVGTLPAWDEDATCLRDFVGRVDILDGFREALGGLKGRVRSRFEGVRLFWVHGFGGMGKSWLLRRFCDDALRAKGGPHVGFIDWELPDWHRPSNTPPSSVVQVFDVIAYRVAQLSSLERLNPYWEARRDVEAAAMDRGSRVDRLAAALAGLGRLGPDWRATLVAPTDGHGASLAEAEIRLGTLEVLLRRWGLWSEDRDLLRSRLRELEWQLPFERTKRDLTTDWVREIDPSAKPEVAGPTRFLADRLGGSLRRVARDRPLILIFDTCELLHDSTDALDEWLRYLFSHLLDGQTPLLVIVGGRFAPDHAQPPGGRVGWLNEIDPRRREVVSLENRSFTFEEIGQRLKQAARTRPLPNLPDLPDRFMSVTLGLPLAVGVLLNMHADGDAVLSNLPSLDAGAADEVDRDEAVRTVYAKVVGRFLLHLENRPERADDLRDITALALLRRASVELLGRFWGTETPRNRLLQLSRRYELLANGDLHQRVREFLRRHWRNSPPDLLRKIATGLLDALDQDRPEGTPEDERYVAWLLERMNLLGWLQGEDVYPTYIKNLAVLLAHGAEAEGLISLAEEIQPLTRKGREVRKRFIDERSNWYSWYVRPAQIDWLRRQETEKWSNIEVASLRLLTALSLADRSEWNAAYSEFDTAFELFGSALPRRSEVAPRYFACVEKLGQSEVERADRACDWAKRLDLAPEDKWVDNYYWMLHNAHRYAEAERYCRECLAASPHVKNACVYLAHILSVHQSGRLDEAEQVIREGLTLIPDSPDLNLSLARLLAEKPDGITEAFSCFNKSLQNVLSDDTKLEVIQRFADAIPRSDIRKSELYEQALKLKPNDPNVLNYAAWNCYLHSKLDKAETYARRAVEQDKNEKRVYILQTLAAVLVRCERWDEAAPLVKDWVMRVEVSNLKSQWDQNALFLMDAVEQSRVELLAEILGERHEEEWVALRAAVRAAGGNLSDLDGLAPGLTSLASRLQAQLSRETPLLEWPSTSG